MDVDIKKEEEKIEYLSSDPKTLELYKAIERSCCDESLEMRIAFFISFSDRFINSFL